MSSKLRNLKAARARHTDDIRGMGDKAAATGKTLAELGFTELVARSKAAIAEIDVQIEAEYSREGDSSPALPSAMSASAPQDSFSRFGEFLRAVVTASLNPSRADPRLQFEAGAPTTTGSEISGQDGGFAVPPQFARSIFTLALGEDSLLPYTSNLEIAGNGMVFPKDETTPWGTNGIRAYWAGEAAAATPTKPLLSATTLRLHKMLALVPLTDELVSDTNALDSYVPKKGGQSLRWKLNESLLFGTGAGQPLGAFTSGAVVTVAKDTGQSTLTLTIGNITNMICRLPPGSFKNAVWLITPDALPALFQMTLGNYPIYLPIAEAPGEGGAQASPFGMILGRPAFVSQHAAAFSAQGDLLLADLSYYHTITKPGGVQTATSMHLYFDADAIAFRLTFRVDGMPMISKPITQAKGNNLLSPFVQLGAR